MRIYYFGQLIADTTITTEVIDDIYIQNQIDIITSGNGITNLESMLSSHVLALA